jgi:adenylate cyclase
MPNNDTDDLAVLFVDIADSTALYRRLGDIEALRIVSRCMATLGQVLPRHRGRSVKTIGDAMMCLFPDGDSAVGAAIEMHRTMASLRLGGLVIKLRIGLHTGPVVVGGDDVHGDTVNVAAYLADAAGADQILIAVATRDRLEPVHAAATRIIFETTPKAALPRFAVCEVQWRDDLIHRTQINPHHERGAAADNGVLELALGPQLRRVDHWHPIVTIGREAGCELLLTNLVVSRRHATIRIERTHFFIVDHSVNGTFITRSDGAEIRLVRREMMLEGHGEIRPGFSRAAAEEPVISFRRNRSPA